MTISEVVSSVFLARNQLPRVEQFSRPNFIDNSWLQISEYTPRDVLSRASLRKECVESIVTSTHGLVQRRLSIRLDSMLEAIYFPAGITNLNASVCPPATLLDATLSTERHVLPVLPSVFG